MSTRRLAAFRLSFDFNAIQKAHQSRFLFLRDSVAGRADFVLPGEPGGTPPAPRLRDVEKHDHPNGYAHCQTAEKLEHGLIYSQAAGKATLLPKP